jgi:dipeptidyl aminopeptidase/acylaminoacyl peptidase
VSDQEWNAAWRRLAEQQIDIANDERDAGYLRSSGERLLRASVALYLAQTRIGDRELRERALDMHWEVFRDGMSSARGGFEAVDVPSPDGELAGWWMAGEPGGVAPAIVFYPGFDLDKEMMVMTLRDCFQRRGVGLLVLDGPGIGETLWKRGIPSRPDYEVPTRAAMEYLAARDDVEPDRTGVAGISLGGYYATRAAAFEPQVACCVAWGAVRRFGGGPRPRQDDRGTRTLTDGDYQLMAVMGTDTLEAARERVAAWDLTGKLDGLHQPFLLLHGELDRQVSLAEAKRVFRDVPSKDKELRVFTAGEGGAEHCQIDEPIAARELMSDWCAMKLGGRLN